MHIEFYTPILNKLDKELINITISEKRANINQNIKLLTNAIGTLRNGLLSYQFKTVNEEIFFFKEVKPRVISKLIFNTQLNNNTLICPKSSKKSQVKFFESKIDQIRKYNLQNVEFYEYYKSSAVNFDKQYFTRNKKPIRNHPDNIHQLLDPSFHTSHDFSFAKIMANELLVKHYQKQLINLNKENNKRVNTSNIVTNLNWTNNKVDLIELIYALQTSKSINNGKSDLKEITSVFEEMLNVNLNGYSRAFIEIRNRKLSPTKFLDLLKLSLQKRVDELDN